MKTRYTLAIFFAALALGGAFLWYFSAAPAPKELISPTSFSSQAEMGEAAFEKLKEKLDKEKIIVIGIPPQPKDYQEIVTGFLQAASKTHPKILLLKEPQWPDFEVSGVQTLNYDFNKESHFADMGQFLEALESGNTIVIYTVSLFSTHLIDINAIHRFEKVFNNKVPSLTIGQFAHRHELEHLNQPPCIGSMRDTQGLYQLGCAQLVNSRKHQKALLPLDQATAILVEQSDGDYLLQRYLPKGSHQSE